MSGITSSNDSHLRAVARTRELFDEQENRISRRTDRIFAMLMPVQWLVAIGFALIVAPRTWVGETSATHPHVWIALFFGGIITILPVALALGRPGRVWTRQAIAIGQVLMSALLIHVTGGRIETHFHVFGSLAFLAFYRDWRVMATATAIVAADHFLRGVYWPQSVYGLLTVSPWRWLEHAGWVLFEDCFLLISIAQSRSDMFAVAERQAKVEATNETIIRENAELKRAEEALRQSEFRFRQLAENIREVFWMVAPDASDLLYVSPAYEETWGRTRVAAQAEPKAWMEPIHEEDRVAVAAAAEAGEQGRTFDIEFRITRPNGEVRWIRNRGFPVRDDLGQVVRVCGIAEDVTERKKAESSAVEANRELRELSRRAGMAEVATSVLHNVGNVLNSVNISIGIASEKSRLLKVSSIGRLAAMLRENAHDLPGFFATSRQGAQMPDFLEHLAQHLAADQAAVLGELESLKANIEHINEIVAMQQSYATTGGFIEIVPLNDVIEDALRMNSGALDRHGAKLVRDYDSSLPPLPIDRHKVLQILVNLIRNAKYALDDGNGVDKCITLRTRRNGHGSAKVCVMDNGVGISPENRARIFEHGFTTRKEGHGFGLHSSALAAGEMGGTLTAHSDGPGQGAVFTLELPMASDAS